MGKLTDIVKLLAELKSAAEVLVTVIDSLEDIQKVQSPDITYTERIKVVFAIIIIALFIVALCLA